MQYIINKIIEDLRNEINRKDIKHFFFGLPEAEVAKNLTNDGIIFVSPVSTTVQSVTTGVTDESVNNIAVIVAKNTQTKVYTNANQETGLAFLTRIIDGRKEDGSLNEETVRYVLRSHLREYGLRQPSIEIEYNDNRVDHEGVVTATINIVQEEHYLQTI